MTVSCDSHVVGREQPQLALKKLVSHFFLMVLGLLFLNFCVAAASILGKLYLHNAVEFSSMCYSFPREKEVNLAPVFYCFAVFPSFPPLLLLSTQNNVMQMVGAH